jgi:hypothetical protein
MPPISREFFWFVAHVVLLPMSLVQANLALAEIIAERIII